MQVSFTTNWDLGEVLLRVFVTTKRMQASRAEPDNEHSYHHLQLLTIRSSPSGDPAGNQIHHENDERRQQTISRRLNKLTVLILRLLKLTCSDNNS